MLLIFLSEKKVAVDVVVVDFDCADRIVVENVVGVVDVVVVVVDVVVVVVHVAGGG